MSLCSRAITDVTTYTDPEIFALSGKWAALGLGRRAVPSPGRPTANSTLLPSSRARRRPQRGVIKRPGFSSHVLKRSFESLPRGRCHSTEAGWTRAACPPSTAALSPTTRIYTLDTNLDVTDHGSKFAQVELATPVDVVSSEDLLHLHLIHVEAVEAQRGA